MPGMCYRVWGGHGTGYGEWGRVYGIAYSAGHGVPGFRHRVREAGGYAHVRTVRRAGVRTCAQ